MVIRCEAEIIKATPELYLEIDSHFSKEELSLIESEVCIIKSKDYLHEQVVIGGEILGDILGKQDFKKVLTLSEYVDHIVSKLQRR